MASASALVSTLSVAGAPQIKTGTVKKEFALNSSARLGIASPSATHLRATSTPLRRASKQPQRSFHVNCKTLQSDEIVLDKEDHGVTKEETNALTPSTLQVQSLLEEICDETKIAELKLKVGAFSLHLKRDVGKTKAAAAAAAAASVSTQAVVSPPPVPLPSPAAPAKSTSLTSSLLPATVSKTASLFGLLEAAADQGLSFVTSPKVGVFRRGRNVKGKIGKPLVEEGAVIKEGQVVGYLEQLGTQQPVEAQVSGEVVQVLWEDGESVGYGDPLISIRPSFPGIVSRAALN
ncbi:unnamed protein product [Calypogeia fissa]